MKKERKIVHKKIDGECTKHETRIFKREILKDKDKRDEYRKLKSVVSSSKRVKRVKTPTGFSRAVLRAVQKKKS